MDIIDSPPYPKFSTSPSQLYHALTELYDWTLNQREWANMMASELGAPEDPFVPALGRYPAGDSDRYLHLSVPDMYMSWRAVRAIREKYDTIVRNYETEVEWVSKPAIFHRIGIVKTSALLMSLCFLDTEKREAKEADLVKKQRKHMLALLKDQIGEISNLFNGDDDNDEDIDFDALFHGTDDE